MPSDSKSGGGNIVLVRVRPGAPIATCRSCRAFLIGQSHPCDIDAVELTRLAGSPVGFVLSKHLHWVCFVKPLRWVCFVKTARPPIGFVLSKRRIGFVLSE